MWFFADVPSSGEDQPENEEAGIVRPNAQHSCRVCRNLGKHSFFYFVQVWRLVSLCLPAIIILNFFFLFFLSSWLSLGNQLNGVRLVDEGLRARFKAAYPDVEVQPPSPPRASSAAEADPGAAQMRSPYVGSESKPPPLPRPFMDQSQSEASDAWPPLLQLPPPGGWLVWGCPMIYAGLFGIRAALLASSSVWVF